MRTTFVLLTINDVASLSRPMAYRCVRCIQQLIIVASVQLPRVLDARFDVDLSESQQGDVSSVICDRWWHLKWRWNAIDVQLLSKSRTTLWGSEILRMPGTCKLAFESMHPNKRDLMTVRRCSTQWRSEEFWVGDDTPKVSMGVSVGGDNFIPEDATSERLARF